ncbi:transmembrane protein, putative (macronuclear) [Tetrahymena thermophila SB210]|uniref:Transmembrane protein, putative n=1 Tax=Tetrahymena thermophila (strain SB210) TaxID=312017 RepID=Q22WB6_TETTS|nr:transmembrane protein, putative [Tetrahymena thermophila SB210]EAR89501.1 transmembrane protein, putative [Tetrahymena thermophila SB210]|eukprot:XP_001009746.1 transmembrane protein, putative [Tetrahymena thermophila SB210]
MRTNKQNQKKGYQEFDSNDEEQNMSNNSNFDDSSSDKNSANMGSAPEDSNDDEDNNNNYSKSNKDKQKLAKGQENVRGIQNKQGQSANAKTIQMADLKQNQNYGNERQKQQQKNNYNDSDEEDEIPSQNYNQQRTANQSLNTRSLNQMKDQKSQLVNQREQKSQQYQNSSDEEEEDDVEYNPNAQKRDDKRLVAAQQGQNQLNRNQNQIQVQKKAPPKPAISKIAQNIKGQQKHVKLVEDDEDFQQQNNHEEEEEEEEIDEVNYQQKTNRLKEEKEIRQRLSDERKRELEKNKKKKKSTKLDADENEENDDDDDEDDDDDYDYDYDDFNEENRRKREEYDFSNTITYWIGFVIIVVFMSILYYFMISRGFTTSYRDQQQNKQVQNKPVLLYSSSSYPLDVYFQNEFWKQTKHLQDRREEATCQSDIAEDPFFDFSIQVSQEKTRLFNSYINIECQNQCQILQIQEKLQNIEVKQQDQKVPKLSFEDLVKEYKCDGERESFFNGKCQECNELCLQCSQFTHTCYSCYDQEYLTNKKCQTSCDGQQSAINHFCIQQKPNMNLQILKGMQHNMYILHTPETPQSFKDQLLRQQVAIEEAKKKAQTNSTTTQNKTQEIEQNKKEEFKLKKYPFIFLLNDYRYTQDDVFLTKQVEKYFDQAFLLSIPYFKEMLTASELDNLIEEIIDNTLDQDITQFVDFYAVMGYGLTGQLAIQIGLEQKEYYYKKRISIATAVSDSSFAAIINQDSKSFENYIEKQETYFKDNLFCYLSQKKKQIKSTQVEFKKDIEADNQESKLHDHLDFYLKHSFDEILLHYKNEKLSQIF